MPNNFLSRRLAGETAYGQREIKIRWLIFSFLFGRDDGNQRAAVSRLRTSNKSLYHISSVPRAFVAAKDLQAFLF